MGNVINVNSYGLSRIYWFKIFMAIVLWSNAISFAKRAFVRFTRPKWSISCFLIDFKHRLSFKSQSILPNVIYLNRAAYIIRLIKISSEISTTQFRAHLSNMPKCQKSHTVDLFHQTFKLHTNAHIQLILCGDWQLAYEMNAMALILSRSDCNATQSECSFIRTVISFWRQANCNKSNRNSLSLRLWKSN